jgi:hypothetical protein
MVKYSGVGLMDVVHAANLRRVTRVSMICYRCHSTVSFELYAPAACWLFGISVTRFSMHKTNGPTLLSWVVDPVCNTCNPIR